MMGWNMNQGLKKSEEEERSKKILEVL